MKHVLGIDIGGTFIRAGVVDEDLNLISNTIGYTNEILGEDDNIVHLAEWAKKTIEETGIKVDAISIGFPAVVNKERTMVVSAPNVKGVENIDIPKVMEEKLDIRTFIERDANILLMFDIENLKLPKNGIIAGLYFGTGIGNAVSIDGKIMIGKNGAACEIGHIALPEENDLCECGNRGCLELYASGKALNKLNDKLYPGEDIKEIFVRHGKEKEVLQLVDDLARTAALEANIFDPDYLIIGGGLPAMKGFPKEEFLKLVIEHTRKPLPAETLQIRYNMPKQENGIIGSAILAFSEMKDI